MEAVRQVVGKEEATARLHHMDGAGDARFTAPLPGQDHLPIRVLQMLANMENGTNRLRTDGEGVSAPTAAGSSRQRTKPLSGTGCRMAGRAGVSDMAGLLPTRINAKGG